MKKKNFLRVVVLFVVVPLLVLMTSYAHAFEVRGVTDSTIKVGIIGDHTGPTADLQLKIVEGIKNYIRYENEQGGIHGRKVILADEDCHYSIPTAIAAFKKLVSKDEIFALLIGSSSGSMKIFQPRCDRLKLPFITSALSETLLPPVSKFSRYTFYGTSSYSDGIGLLFDYIMKDIKVKNPRIAFVYPDNEMGKAGLKGARRYAKAYGVKLISEDVLAPGAMDATSQVLSLKRAKANCVIIHAYLSPNAILLRDARKFAFKANFFGAMLAAQDEVVQMAGKAAKGFITVHCFSMWYDDTPGMADVRKITLAYKPGTEKPYRHRYYTQGWVFGVMLSEAMKRAGRDLTPEGVVAALEGFKKFDTRGLCGPLSFGPNDHVGFKYNKLLKADIDKMRYVPISDWRKPIHME